MNGKHKKWKLILAGLMAGMLLGGTIAVTTPSVAAGPAKIWKQIKKKADKRYYTKTKSNKRYQKKPTVIRGAISLGSAPVGGYALTPIHWGVWLEAAPTAHIITNGGAVPAGCSGTPASPSASPGHLCIFEQAASGYTGRFVCSAVNSCGGKVSPFGAYYGATTTGGSSFMYGSWAVGVDDFSTAKIAAKTSVSGANGGPPGGK